MEFVGKAAPEHMQTLFNRRAANPRHTEIFHRHPGHRAYIEHAEDVAIENQKQFGRIAESDIIGVPARTHSPPTKRLAIAFACRRSSQPSEIPEEDCHKTYFSQKICSPSNLKKEVYQPPKYARQIHAKQYKMISFNVFIDLIL